MSLPILPPSLSGVQFPPLSATPPRATAATGEDFADVLAGSMKTVERLGIEARQSAERFLAGEGEELHQVALSAQRAELSFDLFLQVRNKVVTAYQEIMRMQL